MTSAGWAVVCDVDGTLVDTNHLHVLAWWRALRDEGRTVPMATIHHLVGMGADQLVPRLVGHEDGALAAGHSRHFRELMGEATALPGASELIRALHGEGVRVVLGTSSDLSEVEGFVDLLHIGDAIDGIVSGDDIERSKPAPDVFADALARFGLDPHRTCALGDSVWDVRSAEAAGLRCATVETGGFTRSELLDAGAVAVYDDAAAIVTELPWERLRSRWMG